MGCCQITNMNTLFLWVCGCVGVCMREREREVCFALLCFEGNLRKGMRNLMLGVGAYGMLCEL